ncbi:hypothetical protein EUGRSUZ_I01695 [Eucalyptus grandis]|uniref:Uncharacterized protein n=2 Tax=Eucalyptus grandis TaxID=71139 RepID=A0ACC3JIU3_EUCGR|nr:hypothetical protein EUGRSUZ_I01695 [Eucalyptus grandis]
MSLQIKIFRNDCHKRLICNHTTKMIKIIILFNLVTQNLSLGFLIFWQLETLHVKRQSQWYLHHHSKNSPSERYLSQFKQQ